MTLSNKLLLYPRLPTGTVFYRALHKSAPLRGGLGDMSWAWERNAGRAVVGHGQSGNESYYCDRYDFWYPGIRFRRDDKVIAPIRSKELGDWKNLTLEEKKLLYRYSFRQTMSELDAPKPYWKLTWFYTMYGSIVCVIFYFLEEWAMGGRVHNPFVDPEWKEVSVEGELYQDIGYPGIGYTHSPYFDYENQKWK